MNRYFVALHSKTFIVQKVRLIFSRLHFLTEAVHSLDIIASLGYLNESCAMGPVPQLTSSRFILECTLTEDKGQKT